MGMLEELNDLLDRLPLWKRLSAMPDKVQALEQRVAALEAQLAGKPGELCPMCNAPAFQRTGTAPHPYFGDTGLMQDSYQCQSCAHSEIRMRDTAR